MKIAKQMCLINLMKNILIFVRCSDLVAIINSGSIISLLPPNILMLAFTLYNIENVSYPKGFFSSTFRCSLFYYFTIIFQSSSDIVMVFLHIMCAIVSLAWPILYCYFATSITDRVLSIAYSVYDSNWFDYPPKLRRIVILSILRSRKPADFSGFGLIGCNLETLGNVRI